MVKRIMMYLAIGVSFMPAAFANSGLMGVETCIAQVGESRQCQLDNAVGATQCDRQKILTESDREEARNGKSAAGIAR